MEAAGGEGASAQGWRAGARAQAEGALSDTPCCASVTTSSQLGSVLAARSAPGPAPLLPAADAHWWWLQAGPAPDPGTQHHEGLL